MYKTISRVVSVALLLICVYQSYIALVQWQWHFFSLTWAFRVSGTFLRSTELALLLAFMLPWLCYSSLCLLRWKSSNWIDRLLSLIIFASLPLPILALIATCCRAAWMAALSGCVLVVCLFLMKQSGKICIQRRHAILFIIGLSLVYTFVYFFKKDSADGRQLIWKVTVWQMTHHPKGLLMGYGSFSSFYGEAQETYFRTKERPIREQYLAGAPDYAYNEYLQLLVEHGLMVFGVIMIVLLQLLRELWRNCNKDSLPLFCCVISFLMAALFSYPFHLFAPCFLSVTLILLAIYNCYENHFEKGRWLICLLMLTLLIMTYGGLMHNFGRTKKHRMAMHQYLEVHNIQARKHSVKLAKCYQNLYPYLYRNLQFLLDYGSCLTDIKWYAECRKVMKIGQSLSGDMVFWVVEGQCFHAEGDFPKAISCYRKAHYRIPHKIRPLYLMMNAYKEMGATDSMIIIAHKMVAMKPKVKSNDFSLMQDSARAVLSTTVLSHEQRSNIIL